MSFELLVIIVNLLGSCLLVYGAYNVFKNLHKVLDGVGMWISCEGEEFDKAKENMIRNEFIALCGIDLYH
jgi:hypothetical protein